jgi:succinoglycan biosynthesis protein ExoM
MKKPEIKYILISCCTCKRPNMLKQSLASISNMLLPENIKIEILVIDNDKEASGKIIVKEFQNNFPIKINYFIEDQRGISNARNRLLKESLKLGASHIALFDDDEILDENWLISHANYYGQNPDALIVSGPTYNKFQKKYPEYIEKNKVFKQSTTKKTGLIRDYCASGNVFFPTAITRESNIYFDNSHVFMGGEDGDFFARASKAGYTIVWNNDAINYEMIGDERANIKWILNRSYYNGYSGYFLKFKDNKNVLIKIRFLAKIVPVLWVWRG